MAFAAPVTGASATLSSASAVTAADGTASITAIANATVGGPYSVSATAGALTANFALTNLPATFTVTTLTDDAYGNLSNCPAGNIPASSNCSLRDAIAAADWLVGDNITTAVPTITFAGTLTGTASVDVGGTLAAANNMQIIGPGANVITIASANKYAILYNEHKTVNISGLTFSGGISTGGSAIQNFGGTMSVTDCAFTGNASTNLNSGAINGGAILNLSYSGGTIEAAIMTVIGSTFNGNSAVGNGGAIMNVGTLTVIDSTFSGNSATGMGGAIYNSTSDGASYTGLGQVTVTNSTFSGNTDGNSGAGINNAATFALNNSIVTDKIQGTTSSSTNAIAGTNGATSGNIALAPLANYGGPTQTMIPLPGSVAICAGTNLTGPYWQDANGNALTTDQRGTGYPNTNSTYTGYTTTACVDVGAVQTNYSLGFSTEPPLTVSAITDFSAAVSLDESGKVFTPGTGSVALALSGTGTLTGGTGSFSGGVANFSALQVTSGGTGDKLTAQLWCWILPVLPPPASLRSVRASVYPRQQLLWAQRRPLWRPEQLGLPMPVRASLHPEVRGPTPTRFRLAVCPLG